MGTRYGRRRRDGTYEYHDSEASLQAAKRREGRETRAGFFGLVGLVIGGWLTYLGLQYIGTAEWPKWTRFVGILVGAAVGATLLFKLAEVVWKLFVALLAIVVILTIGLFLWNAI